MKRKLTILSCVIAFLGMTGCELSNEAKESIKQTGIILIKSIPFSESESGMLEIPQVPAMEPIVKMDHVSLHLTIQEHWSHAKVSPLADRTYIMPTHESMLDVLSWAASMRELIPKGADGKTYQAETSDCDNFARWLTFATDMAAARGRIRGSPLVGRFWVQQVTPFAGVPAGGNHALNWWVDEHGLWVIEPQNGEYVLAATIDKSPFRLAKIKPTGLYPNYDHITHIFCD